MGVDTLTGGCGTERREVKVRREKKRGKEENRSREETLGELKKNHDGQLRQLYSQIKQVQISLVGKQRYLEQVN